MIEKLKKQIDIISSLIEVWCKKKTVFVHTLLTFGIVEEAHTHCTDLHIAQADPQINICKSVQFLLITKLINLPYIFKTILCGKIVKQI